MGNIVKFSTPVSVNSIKSGGFNIGVNGTPADLTGFYTGICPINGGYTIYIDKSENGPSIYTPNNDTQLINITKGLGGNITTAAEALVWINSQSNMTVVNSNYPSIVTNGLVMNLDAGFVSSYPKTGTTWKDLSGNGYDGILTNGPTFNSENNGSIVFDGIDDYVGLSSTLSSLNGTTEASLVMWIKLDNASNGTGQSGIIQLSNWDNSNGNLYFYNNGYTYLDIFRTNRLNTVIENSTVDPTIWHMLTITTTPGVNGWKLYWNDTLKYQTTGQNTVSVNSSIQGGFTLGKNSSSRELDGGINSCKIYNRALTLQEVQQNYYAGLQRFIPTNGLILSLDAQNTNLYATSATTAYDISGNGNNGTLINGVQYVGDADGSWGFDATDDRIYAESNVLITNDFTFTVWAKRDGNSSTSIGGIFGNHIHTELSGANLFFRNSSTTVEMSAGNGVTRPSFQISIPRLNTLWNFYVIRYSGTTYQLYFNGVLLDSRTAPVVQSLNTNKYSLGVWAFSYLSGYYLNGKISQCSTYNRALTQTEITTIFNATRARYEL